MEQQRDNSGLEKQLKNVKEGIPILETNSLNYAPSRNQNVKKKVVTGLIMGAALLAACGTAVAIKELFNLYNLMDAGIYVY